MKRVRLTISYDGTAYHGWQFQSNAITVQQIMCECLQELLGKQTSVTGCSRTDAGVHAREFCCHIDCEDNIPDDAFLRGLNSILPDDIAVKSVKRVEDSFHARYSALGKLYSYCFYHSPITDPFLSRYALRLDRKPDIDLINEFCKTVIGKHDFCGFSSAKRTVEDTVRTVKECYFEEQNGIYRFNISADGFLYNMVRIIAGTAIDVSLGRLSVGCAEEVFETKSREGAGKTLPPNGLFLEKVFY